MPTIYTQSDLTAIQQQKKQRWLCGLIPCAVLLAVMV